MSLLDILFRRSPKNAAVPRAQPGPPGASASPSPGSSAQPLERNIEVHSIRGLQNELHRLDGRYRSADGELISRSEAEEGLLLTCGHIGTAFRPSPEKDRAETWIADLCRYCVREYQPLVEKGELDPLQAERLSLVCNQCARMSVSGHFCCPRHCQAVVTPDGATEYLDPDAAKDRARRHVVAQAARALQWLFGEAQGPEERKTDQE